jgi:hypothetical protein
MSTNQCLWRVTVGGYEAILKAAKGLITKRGYIHHAHARTILNKNFFGVEEWRTFYGVNFSERQLQEVAKFPWNEEVLTAPCPFVNGRSIKETHFAFLGLEAINGKPLTIMEFHKLHPRPGHPRLSTGGGLWYESQTFATNTTCSLQWYFMLQEVYPNFVNKSYEEQVAMLPSEYRVSLTVEEVTKDILFFRKNGLYPNQGMYGRCQDSYLYEGTHVTVSPRVIVGSDDQFGVIVDRYLDGPGESIGLSACRKF